MSDFHFYCAICGETLHAAREAAGGLIECDCCGRVVPVPGYPVSAEKTERWLGIFRPEILEIVMKFLCSECKSKLSFDVRREGQKGVCPICHSKITAPRWSLPGESEVSPALASRSALTSLPMLSAAEVEFLSGVDDVAETQALLDHAP